jgi:SAM-dependent methyltransferase
MSLPEHASTRTSVCPICGGGTEFLLHFSFGKKFGLPEAPELRLCRADDFAFIIGAAQAAYDAYYGTIINDYCHEEIAPSPASPIALQAEHLISLVPDRLLDGKRILDFGCGRGRLLRLLAARYPAVTFTGYDPNPVAAYAAANLRLTTDFSTLAGPYDLIIMSHVLEHFVDFPCLTAARQLLAADGALYVEVPDAARYADYPRRSFLYYFDRIHINHFSRTALAQLLGRHGFRETAHITYDFPYPDGWRYPAMGMLLHKGTVSSPAASVLPEGIRRYISQEQARAGEIIAPLHTHDQLLVWGGGDNFCRQMTNGGPLSLIKNITLLDNTLRNISIGGRNYVSMPPETGLRQFAAPVIVTVSEASASIIRQIHAIDPERQYLLV